MSQAIARRQLKKIAFLVGHWDVIMAVKSDPRADWVENRGESVFAWILDDTVLEQTYKGSLMGRPFLGIGHLAFNRFSGKWQHTWSDNAAGILSIYEGNFGEKDLVVIGRETTGPASFSVRVSWYNIADGKFDWMLETSVDGHDWTAVMKAVYVRTNA